MNLLCYKSIFGFLFQPPYKFIVFVVVASVTLDIPRFFHFKLEEDQKDYWTTDLHENPSYIQFISYWDELTVTGFAPLIALMYFNIKIYLKVRLGPLKVHPKVKYQN